MLFRSGAKLENEWKKIENRIQLSRENIEASNVTAAEANAQKAVAEWNSAVIQAEIDADTKAERTQMIIEQLSNIRKQGALMVANRELSEKQNFLLVQKHQIRFQLSIYMPNELLLSDGLIQQCCDHFQEGCLQIAW